MTAASDPPNGPASGDAAARRVAERAAELLAKGNPAARARGIAVLESRIARWPADWGGDMLVLIHGDFTPLAAPERFDALGITIEAGEVRDSILGPAQCVVRARVSVAERTVAGVIDAANRIDTLLGALVATSAGAGSIGWWCHLTHGAAPRAVPRAAPPLVTPRAVTNLAATRGLPLEVRRKVRAAMVWINDPRPTAPEVYRLDLLRRYAGYWNAFECLVDAVCLLKPPPDLSAQQKADGIRDFIVAHGGTLGPAELAACHARYAEPGFIARATHALGASFGPAAKEHVDLCFHARPERSRLYHLSRAVIGGSVDVDSLKERVRIEGCQARLTRIVSGMLASLLRP